MQIDSRLAFKVGRGTHLELLADLGRQLINRIPDCLARWQDGSVGRLDAVGLARRYGLHGVYSQRLEGLVLGDKVRLSPQLEQRPSGGSHESVRSGPLSATLSRLGLAAHSQDVDGLIEVAVGLSQCLLAIHHARAGSVAEFL